MNHVRSPHAGLKQHPAFDNPHYGHVRVYLLNGESFEGYYDDREVPNPDVADGPLWTMYSYDHQVDHHPWIIIPWTSIAAIVGVVLPAKES